MNVLNEWQNFYVITGSAAGALIGLQFVVLTLIASLPVLRMAEAGAAFSTPNVVLFGEVLFLSASLSAPWHGIGLVSAIWGLVGLSGLIYAGFVTRHMRRQTAYEPVFSDWFFQVVVPLTAHAVVVGAACAARFEPRGALFVLAGAMLMLLFAGIHNAWDAITYHVFVQRAEPPKS